MNEMDSRRASDRAITATLIVDDGAPVNTMFFHDPPYAHALLMPNALVRDFADVCDEYGVRGKFSVLPMPCGLGGIDGQLGHVPARHLAGFLKLVRTRIAPRFDITPEILTHLAAYRMVEGGFAHVYEDEWFARATVEEMTDYIALALEILDHVGLPASGVTSPWNTGITREADYARAIGEAQWRVHRRAVTWYFLHVAGTGLCRRPTVTYRNEATGQKVVSVPALTNDPFWDTQRPASRTRSAGRAAARAGVDGLLSASGSGGRVAEIVREGAPVAILTHWQSLYSDGSYAGLWGLERLLKRLRKVFGGDLQWVPCSQLAEEAAATAR
jgi:hypothetical protein